MTDSLSSSGEDRRNHAKQNCDREGAVDNEAGHEIEGRRGLTDRA